VLLPSATGWNTQRCQISCSLPTHYATNVAPHIGTVLYLHVNTCLPNITKNLISRPNQQRPAGVGGGGRQKHTKTHENCEHLLKYVVMSLKYRLPTWRLHATKPYDSTTRQTPTGPEWLSSSKWFSQRPLLSEQQRGTRNDHLL
jgi:hypothetical protein